MITVAIEAVMRRSEIAAMKWEHIDWETRTLLIPETKNGTPHEKGLNPMEVAAITLDSAVGAGNVP